MSVGNSERLLATAAEIGAVFAAEAAEGERLRELSRAALCPRAAARAKPGSIDWAFCRLRNMRAAEINRTRESVT